MGYKHTLCERGVSKSPLLNDVALVALVEGSVELKIRKQSQKEERRKKKKGGEEDGLRSESEIGIVFRRSCGGVLSWALYPSQ